VLPAANHRLTTLTNDIARKKPTFALKEQVINEVHRGGFPAIRAAVREQPDARRGHLRHERPLTRTTIRADSGLLELSSTSTTAPHAVSRVVDDAQTGGATSLRRVFFNTDIMKVRNVSNTLEIDTVGGGEKSDREMTVCELQRRVTRLIRRRQRLPRDAGDRQQRREGRCHKRNSLGLGGLYATASGMKLVRTASAMEMPNSRRRRSAPPAAQQARGSRRPAGSARRPGHATGHGRELKLQVALAQGTITATRWRSKKIRDRRGVRDLRAAGRPIALRFPAAALA